MLRQVANTEDQLRRDAEDQDRDYRNRLIEIFGTPYEGTIGAGKPYPDGYAGPDLSLFMYVDVRDISAQTVPIPAASYAERLSAFADDLKNITGDFQPVFNDYFLTNLNDNLAAGAFYGICRSSRGLLNSLRGAGPHAWH